MIFNKIVLSTVFLSIIILFFSCGDSFIDDMLKKGDDSNPPYVVDDSSKPNSISKNHPKNSKLLYYFSEKMYADNIKNSIHLYNSSNKAVNIIANYTDKESGSFALISPSTVLKDGKYTLNINKEARDLSGNKLDPEYKISFQTSDLDKEIPVIVSRTPAPNSMVPINNRRFIIQFNEILDPYNSKPNIELESDTDKIDGTIDIVKDSYIFKYDRDLTLNKKYTVTLTGTIQDLAGNSDDLFKSYSVYTITAVESDSVAPKLTTEPTVEVTQTEAYISYSTDEAATSNIKYGKNIANNSYPIPEDLTANETNHVINLNGLDKGTTYKYKILAKDLSGNTFTSSEYSFTTLKEGETSTIPENKWDQMKWDQGKWQ